MPAWHITFHRRAIGRPLPVTENRPETIAPSSPSRPTRIALVMTGDFHRNGRAIKQSRSLADAGYEIELFHLGGEAPPVPIPESVTLRRLPRPGGRGPLFFRQVTSVFSQALSNVDADLIHASDLYALAACRRRADALGCALTYDAREYYPHVAGTVGKPWARWWWRRLERTHIRRADQVFTVSDSIADALASDYGISRPVVVHNAPPRSTPTIDTASNAGSLASMIDGTGPIVLHLGQMKAHRGCEALVRAMRELPDARLVFLGYGEERARLEELSESLSLSSRVFFRDPVPPDHIRSTIKDAAIGVTMLEDTCLNHRFALPNKLFDYIHAGIPVLGAKLKEVKDIVEGHGIGMTAPPDDPSAIASAIREMLDPDRQAAWRSQLPSAAETFAWESASQRLIVGTARAIDGRHPKYDARSSRTP